MRNFICLMTILVFLSCKKEETTPLDASILTDYISLNENLELADLIACAAGKSNGLSSNDETPTSVFFYPIEGATEFKYFEAGQIADSLDFSKYIEVELTDSPVFNGYLWKFNRPSFAAERMGVVTYKTSGKLHVCTPIRLKLNTKPTEVNADLATITENGLNPSFTWEDGNIDENVIYFQVISDAMGNLISGTYTYEKQFTFYDLSNVVLNITDSTAMPTLEPDSDYNFTMMAVSEDNWVNLLIEKGFRTD